MRARLSLLTSSLFFLLPAGAGAQEIPCHDGPCVARRQPRDDGTHFVAEVNGGGTVLGGRGLMVGGLFGVGGKLRALPFRFYLVGEFAYSGSTDEGLSPSLGISFRDERSRRDIDFGLRIYVPIWGPLRLFGDILGGATYVSASLQRDGLPTVQSSTWGGLAVAAVGLQVRVLRNLSFGARARFTLTGEEPDGLRATMMAESHKPITFMAAMTWHF
jgi:hypothetical protein